MNKQVIDLARLRIPTGERPVAHGMFVRAVPPYGTCIYVTVDAEDVQRLKRYKWRLATNRGGLYVKGGPVNSMGRFLLSLQPGDPRHAHHINSNHRDMRKSNLVAVDPDDHMQLHSRG